MVDDVLADVTFGMPAVASFDDFYRREFAAVLRVAYAITGDNHRAADVAQDAFVAAQKRWRTVSAYERPDLWVRRVAINRALSWRRRSINEIAALTRLASRRESHAPSDALAGDAEVWAHVARLPRRQASVIALVYVDDLSIDQAADVLGISTPTAKTHLQRARRTLARHLNEEIDDDR
ncbi:MAG: putative polymerase subfamily sigma factor [Ilumatobacteraceae bacterium]|nr:putative polymerase subfamily sigma factor [Ilumatobacteraceae bacterium]